MATERREGEKLADISAGRSVYDADGTELRTVRGADDAGFYVPAGGKTGAVTLEEAPDSSGTVYVMWRY